jgi:hypothetical protein
LKDCAPPPAARTGTRAVELHDRLASAQPAGPAGPAGPAAVLATLGALLEAHGHRHLYGAADNRTGLAVLSVRDGTTIWIDTRTRLLRWLEDGAPAQWPLADLDGAADRLTTAPRTRRPADQPR